MFAASFVVHAKRQHAFRHADQHDMGPLQTFGRVERRKCHDVLIFFALVQSRKQGDGLCDLEQVFLLRRHRCASGVFDFAATTLGHPIAKLHHMRPACSGHLRAVFRVVEMFFVIDVFEPGV